MVVFVCLRPIGVLPAAGRQSSVQSQSVCSCWGGGWHRLLVSCHLWSRHCNAGTHMQYMPLCHSILCTGVICVKVSAYYWAYGWTSGSVGLNECLWCLWSELSKALTILAHLCQLVCGREMASYGS